MPHILRVGYSASGIPECLCVPASRYRARSSPPQQFQRVAIDEVQCAFLLPKGPAGTYRQFGWFISPNLQRKNLAFRRGRFAADWTGNYIADWPSKITSTSPLIPTFCRHIVVTITLRYYNPLTKSKQADCLHFVWCGNTKNHESCAKCVGINVY